MAVRLIDSNGPLLLRRVTSTNENQEQQSIPAVSDNNGLNKPKILHHRQTTGNCSPEKQFLSQLNWMRFLFKFNEMFPDISDSGRYTFGLRFIVVKQLFSQLEALESCFNGENPFMIEGWTDFLNNLEKKKQFMQSLKDYRKKYEPLLGQIKEWLPFVGKDKKLTQVVDLNFSRS